MGKVKRGGYVFRFNMDGIWGDMGDGAMFMRNMGDGAMFMNKNRLDDYTYNNILRLIGFEIIIIKSISTIIR